MNNLTVRSRVHPTYLQTFHFSDPPLQKKSPNPCPDHCFNIIDHNIISQQTEEQKQHKNKLNKSQLLQKPLQYESPQKSKETKQKDLRGQLEEMGTGFFYRNKQKPQKQIQKLIPTDCTFNDKCYGRVGFQNEFANYSKKDYDSTLKKAYDIKPFDYSYSDKIYTFAEPKSKKNK